jgi:hypothetical protein
MVNSVRSGLLTGVGYEATADGRMTFINESKVDAQIVWALASDKKNIHEINLKPGDKVTENNFPQEEVIITALQPSLSKRYTTSVTIK